MKKESQKLIDKFIFLVICIVVFFLGIILDLFLLHTYVLSQVSGICIVMFIFFIIFTMIKTNTVVREETALAIKVANQHFQMRYSGAVYCRKGQISKMEKETNPLFINHKVYVKIEVGGRLKGRYFIYRAINIEDVTLKARDHNRHRVRTRFQGGMLQWNEKWLALDTDILICSKGFKPLTKLKFEKSGYKLSCKWENGADVFVKTTVSNSTIKFLRYCYDKAENILKNSINSYEMCIRVNGTMIEVYLYEREYFPEEYIEQRVQLIECFFDTLEVSDSK